MTKGTRYVAVLLLATTASMSAAALGGADEQAGTPGYAAAPAFKTRAIDPVLEAGSPDGKWAIYRKEDAPRKVLLRNLATRADRELITFAATIRAFSWSLDGSQIAFSVDTKGDRNSEVHIVTVADGRDQTLAVRGWVRGWTQAGELFVNDHPAAVGLPATRTTTYYLASPSNPAGRVVFTSPGMPGGSPVRAITPDGKTLIVSSRDGLALRDLAIGSDRDLVRLPGGMLAVSPDGKFVAFQANGALYVAPLDAGLVADPIKLADRLSDLAVSKTGRPTMWWTTAGDLVVPHLVNTTENLYRLDVDTKTGRAGGQLKLLTRNADHPVVSPDSKLVAHTNFAGDSSLNVLPATGGTARALTVAHQHYGWRSPSVVVVVEGAVLKTVDIQTLAKETFLQGPKGFAVDGYSEAADEALFAARATGTTRVLTAFSLATRTERPIISIDRLSSYRASPDGGRIAYGRRTGAEPTSDAELRVVSFDGKEDRLLLTVKGKDVNPCAWSPDGKRLIYFDGSADDSMRVLELATLESWPLIEGPDQPGWWWGHASWAPNGSFVVLGGEADWKDPVGKVFEGVGRATGQSSSGVAGPTASAPTVAAPTRTKVVLLGTGTPVADPDRFGPAVAIVVDDQSYLFDAGVGVVRRAAASGLPALVASKLTRVFLTHLHSDHTLGLPDLMLSPWVLGRSTPIDVYGPPGTVAMTRNIEEAWREDIAMRTYGLEPDHAGARAYRAKPREIQAGRVYEDDKVKIDAIAVPHGSWPEAFGYRIQTVDRVIVISGDTRPTTTLSNACNGCDVLIHEVYPASRVRNPAWQAYDAAYHTSTTELAAVAKAARPRLLVLYHFRGAGPDLEREIAQAGYAGKVIAGKDLDVF